MDVRPTDADSHKHTDSKSVVYVSIDLLASTDTDIQQRIAEHVSRDFT